MIKNTKLIECKNVTCKNGRGGDTKAEIIEVDKE